ncbi:MAG: alpha/beta hydrolase [Marmoricola sp.]|nr:alpha/beta hydrolase [Marmoricola sp.]
MGVSMVPAGAAELCVETFGQQGDPAVLLLGGSTASMDWWEPDFCRRLGEAGRFVVRYDHRDTGQSTSWPAGKPGYTGDDLSNDPLLVLDGLGIDGAHLVGVSMGGGIAQDVAVRQPDRVLSLTLVATSPAFARAGTSPLPPPEPRVAATFEQEAPDLDWTDEAAVVEELVNAQRPYAGWAGFDEDHVREIGRTVVARTRDMEASVANHWVVIGGGGEAVHTMAEIDAPTLVLHGTDDPLFPFPHGQALVAEIPGATLVALEGMGHEVPPRMFWDVVVPAIVEHTGGQNAAR